MGGGTPGFAPPAPPPTPTASRLLTLCPATSPGLRRCGGTPRPTRCGPHCGCSWPTCLPTCRCCCLPPPTCRPRVRGGLAAAEVGMRQVSSHRVGGSACGQCAPLSPLHDTTKARLGSPLPLASPPPLRPPAPLTAHPPRSPLTRPLPSAQSWTQRCASCSTCSRAARTSWARLTPSSGRASSPAWPRWGAAGRAGGAGQGREARAWLAPPGCIKTRGVRTRRAHACDSPAGHTVCTCPQRAGAGPAGAAGAGGARGAADAAAGAAPGA